jgi:hypothetical protein
MAHEDCGTGVLLRRPVEGVAMGIFSSGVARRMIALPALLLLVSCGGGGGGGSGGGTSSDPVAYAGNSSPAVITTTNASTLTANVIGGGDTATTILGVSGASIEGGDATQERSSGVIDLARRLNHGLRDTLLRLNDAQRVAAAVQIDDTEPCDNGVGSVRRSGTLSDATLTGTLMVSFNGCLTDGVTLNGSATLRVDEFSFAFPQGIPSDSTLSFARLTIMGAGISLDAGGSLRLQLNFGTNTETVTANLVALDNSTGQMTRSENLVLVDVYDNIFSPSSYTETMTGRVFDSAHGFVDVGTTEPLAFTTLSQFPNLGQLVLTGFGNRSIRVTATSATQVKLELDLDGDANYELWTTILWTQVSEAAVVDFVRPTAPVVSVAANFDRSVAINWTSSSDSNGIREYRILRGTMPVGRTTGTSFVDRSVEPGSTVDYYVRAVDNAGNVSDLLPRQSVTIPSGGTGTFAVPISGTMPFTTNTSGVGIGVADVNGDGSRDLVVSGGDTNQVATALGPLASGISLTASPTDFATITNDYNLPFFQLANITGSNLPEALGAGRTLVWNVTNNVWEDSAASNQSFQLEARAYVDLNDDGIPDIMNFASGRLFGTLGTGTGSYDASSRRELAGTKSFVWGRIGAIVATDVDRNGLTDLLVWDADTIRVVRQTQRGAFAVTVGLPAIDNLGFRTVLLVADVTGDGYPEIMFADYANGNVLRVYVNDGAGNFAGTAIASGVSEPWNFAAGDLNGDGIQDLVVGNRLTNALDLYMSQGDGTFTFLSSISGAGFPFIALADCDLDGDMDIVVAGSFFRSADIGIHLNQ